MNDVDILFNLVSKSNLTLIGYTHKDEKLKNDFISKLNPLFIDSVDSSSMQSSIRDFKISNILNGSNNFKSIVFDLNQSLIYSGEKTKYIRNIADALRKTSELGYIPIMTSLLYKAVSDISTYNFTGGSAGLYASDLVIRLENGNINVIKNRNGDSFSIPYSKLEKLLYI